ncbi:hypothetical protein Q4511_16235 [Paracoccus sp. 1_MG-2023]|uniref:hypothetical protein n=1 Tax=unclassified Paracoccus (in: a-proteobacteria) TaxID=2688777 RepID=UPI001C0863B4|nr:MULTISPECIES: hypothetical protein [unclassified Paracoccus (in: a-proteobacteria)]MBU2956793.1 hypothetical protein [Paracoccus sp. C2R09]MDO6670460.1 hypothetical protein [Paracoccus sp. 1_MG-2023]
MTLTYDLITDKDYDNLPDDPESQFITIEAICRRNMSSMITENTPNTFDTLVRLQYMSTVFAAAAELGFHGLPDYERLDDPTDGFDRFLMSANSLVTKLRIRNAGRSSPTSVKLTIKTKRLIEYEIEKLKDIIENSDLEESKRKSLLGKLEDLIEEIHRPRVRFSIIMASLAAIGLGLSGTASFLADAPSAIATIASLIGQDKEEEKLVKEVVAQPSPKALPPPSTNTDSEYDDEIPF